jgi:hypothetical protein
MSTSEERRARRAALPIRSFALGQEPSDDLSASTTMDERLAMVWPLTRAAYEAAGLPLDPPPRHLLPGRVIRPEDP